jgi:hypothetical protein
MHCNGGPRGSRIFQLLEQLQNTIPRGQVYARALAAISARCETSEPGKRTWQAPVIGE